MYDLRYVVKYMCWVVLKSLFTHFCIFFVRPFNQDVFVSTTLGFPVILDG
jgi:hypothetical protein